MNIVIGIIIVSFLVSAILSALFVNALRISKKQREAIERIEVKRKESISDRAFKCMLLPFSLFGNYSHEELKREGYYGDTDE